jgi:hypothetical protein
MYCNILYVDIEINISLDLINRKYQKIETSIIKHEVLNKRKDLSIDNYINTDNS